MSRTTKPQLIMAGSRPAYTRSRELPEWTRPPLDEVAIAVQFNELSGFQSVHYGLFYSQVRNEFPGVDERQRVLPKFETFGQRAAGSFDLEVAQTPPLRRVWLLSADEHELLQLQPDRFIFNWRKRSGEGVYRRFDSIYPKFRQYLTQFSDFTEAQKLGNVKINQCELSYFNNITLVAGENFSAAMSRIFTHWKGAPTVSGAAGASIEPEIGRFDLSFVVRMQENSEPLGRVHVNTTPGYNEETKEQLIRLTIVFRGPPLTSAKLDPLDQTMGFGRDSIVRVFDLLGTSEAHRTWGRKAPALRRRDVAPRRR